MFLNILKQLNWLDIFVIIIVLRTSYVAVKTGIFIELFKFLGTLFACYVSLHYFTTLSDVLKTRIPPPPNVPLEIWDFFAFLVLVIVGYLILVLLRETFFRFVKTETVSLLNKWGALVLGMARGFILVSLLIFLLSLPVVDYFVNSVRDSFSGRRLIKISTGVYTALWNNLASKFMPSEGLNRVVQEVQRNVQVK